MAKSFDNPIASKNTLFLLLGYTVLIIIIVLLSKSSPWGEITDSWIITGIETEGDSTFFRLYHLKDSTDYTLAVKNPGRVYDYQKYGVKYVYQANRTLRFLFKSEKGTWIVIHKSDLETGSNLSTSGIITEIRFNDADLVKITNPQDKLKPGTSWVPGYFYLYLSTLVNRENPPF